MLGLQLQRLTGTTGPARSSPTVDVTELANNKDSAETSGSSNSSDVLDAESPRTVDSSSLEQNFQEQFADEFPPESCFMVPDVRDAAVKLEDHDGSAAAVTTSVDEFTDVDQSCNYLLPLQLYEQSGVLPWWDWPEISR